MRVIVEVGHPAHVHNFRHVIGGLRQRGHEVMVFAWHKDVTLQLLNAYGIDYELLGTNPGAGTLRKALYGCKAALVMWKAARHFGPDVFLSRVSPVAGCVSRLYRKPHIAFADTDVRHLANTIGLPLTDIVVTPDCYRQDLGRKQVRINSYKELSYLHPRYFTPAPEHLLKAGIDMGTPFAIVRFVAWRASHDNGQHGFSKEGRVRLVQGLSRYGRVLVSSEADLDPEIRQYAFKAEPHLIHHFLSYATVCVTEGATMASECAVLGTPAIYVNSLSLGSLNEQQERYGIVSNFHHRQAEDTAIHTAIGMMREGASQREAWRAKGTRLVQDCVDVTEFLVRTTLTWGRGMPG
ncbi:MAG: DUF354 domain-containing protein [Dehalococcoidia bacterium]|nr:DUF354 domain-containing protein [Dehalococcoidia bacterium]